MENEENPQPEENNEIPVEETITAKKYIIKSGNIVSLPENYSTDDEDEMRIFLLGRNIQIKMELNYILNHIQQKMKKGKILNQLLVIVRLFLIFQRVK